MERLQLTAKKNNFTSKDLTSHYSMANLCFFNVWNGWGAGEGGGGGGGGSMNIRLQTSLELHPPSIRLRRGELIRWFM